MKCLTLYDCETSEARLDVQWGKAGCVIELQGIAEVPEDDEGAAAVLGVILNSNQVRTLIAHLQAGLR